MIWLDLPWLFTTFSLSKEFKCLFWHVFFRCKKFAWISPNHSGAGPPVYPRNDGDVVGSSCNVPAIWSPCSGCSWWQVYNKHVMCLHCVYSIPLTNQPQPRHRYPLRLMTNSTSTTNLWQTCKTRNLPSSTKPNRRKGSKNSKEPKSTAFLFVFVCFVWKLEDNMGDTMKHHQK